MAENQNQKRKPEWNVVMTRKNDTLRIGAMLSRSDGRFPGYSLKIGKLLEGSDEPTAFIGIHVDYNGAQPVVTNATMLRDQIDSWVTEAIEFVKEDAAQQNRTRQEERETRLGNFGQRKPRKGDLGYTGK